MLIYFLVCPRLINWMHVCPMDILYKRNHRRISITILFSDYGRDTVHAQFLTCEKTPLACNEFKLSVRTRSDCYRVNQASLPYAIGQVVKACIFHPGAQILTRIEL